MSSAHADLTREIAQRLGRTVEWGMRMNHSAASSLNINTSDMFCLQALQSGSKTAGELARHLGITTASTTTMIDRLERAGFVTRTRDPQDRRRVAVQLVDDRARQEIAPLFAPLVRSWLQHLADYDEAELRVIAGFLASVEESFAAEIEG
ncbi:MarR family transcriptional regulator [Gordonia sp. PKS22-38]|uniref:MarR family transcriptional regulator n=1 Tax=Gordonia prachuapensis TaxID=3115651 RepID=A0ABU7MUX6_9ACTN|nr:MarR family transcriptional regulator [Gordonia sp. PKS22-38]